jgi:DNA repair exonuclease SbcCD ATPase subunit
VCSSDLQKLPILDTLIKDLKFSREKLDSNRIKFKALRDEYKRSVDKERDARERFNKISNIIESLRHKLEKYNISSKHNSQVENIRDKCVATINKLDKYLATYKKLEDIFGVNGYRKYLISSVIQRINNEINNLIGEVLNVSVELYIDRTKFDMRIMRSGGELGKESLSGGEQRLLSIVFNIAVVKVLIGSNMNCLFYDEVLAQLDETNGTNMLFTLGEIAKRLKISIFLVTNQKHLVDASNDYAAGKIVVKFKGGKSIVEQN